jgi:hypothetical protein
MECVCEALGLKKSSGECVPLLPYIPIGCVLVSLITLFKSISFTMSLFIIHIFS